MYGRRRIEEPRVQRQMESKGRGGGEEEEEEVISIRLLSELGVIVLRLLTPTRAITNTSKKCSVRHRHTSSTDTRSPSQSSSDPKGHLSEENTKSAYNNNNSIMPRAVPVGRAVTGHSAAPGESPHRYETLSLQRCIFAPRCQYPK